MIRAVFDTNVLVSAFLTRHQPGGVSTEIMRFVEDRSVELCLSAEIIQETAATLLRSARLQARYRYTPDQAIQYCADLFTIARIIVDPPELLIATSRDPDDDKIIACAVAADVPYLVTRDLDLLSLITYQTIAIISPEVFLERLRTQVPSA